MNQYLDLLSLPSGSASAKKVPKSRQTIELRFTDSLHLKDVCEPSCIDVNENVVDLVDDSISSVMESLQLSAVRPPPTKQYIDMKLLLPPLDSKDQDIISQKYCFVISAKWLRSWEAHVSGNSCDGPAVEPAEIDNWPLLDDANRLEKSYSYYKCSFPLRRGLRESVDFVCLPPEAWEALRSWYGGGPPLPRRYSEPQSTPAADEATMRIPDLWPSDPPSVFGILEDDSTTSAVARPTAAVNGAPALIRRSVSTVFNDCGSGGVQDDTQNTQRSADLMANERGSYETSAVSPKKVCFVCKKSSTMRCSKCSAVNYCTRDCQRAHWKYHKKVTTH
jgi:hypothetical protein